MNGGLTVSKNLYRKVFFMLSYVFIMEIESSVGSIARALENLL